MNESRRVYLYKDVEFVRGEETVNVNFIAQDADGEIWGFTNKPVIDNDMWRCAVIGESNNESTRMHLYNPFEIPDWENSLEEAL